jgi:uncharacterized membrane protein YciS (DUF1049 family)
MLHFLKFRSKLPLEIDHLVLPTGLQDNQLIGFDYGLLSCRFQLLHLLFLVSDVGFEFGNLIICIIFLLLQIFLYEGVLANLFLQTAPDLLERLYLTFIHEHVSRKGVPFLIDLLL